ncbi:class I SAM-dependent methyltransferase [Methanolobus chelungpuianus]|uniref:Peptidoglycan-binding protein LysM n=1 Tax=Methanolobus chelungpuianus TaxID=502115 RepID=A0AAE3KV58_9EURY|nr:class I SAM-dependent methyltransferase [Methanolobus chelungpuianus]MCQ6961670.1 peptidoglycan-binding protein LysM [Methanolobus chelungpuianus]
MDTRSHILAWDEEYRHVRWGGPRPVSAVEKEVLPGSLVLDAGCGNGRYLLPLSKKYDVVGADVSMNALSEARSYLARSDRHAECIASTLTALPFSANSFDAVVCYGVMQHLFESERTLAAEEIRRVLKPSGILFIEVFGTDDMRFGGHEVEHNTFLRNGGIIYHYFTEQELVSLLGGFVQVDLQSIRTEKTFNGELHTRHLIKGKASLQKAIPR